MSMVLLLEALVISFIYNKSCILTNEGTNTDIKKLFQFSQLCEHTEGRIYHVLGHRGIHRWHTVMQHLRNE